MEHLGTSPPAEDAFSQIYPRHAPQWLPDEASTTCMGCGATFGIFVGRRHHCRMCGRLFCHPCTGQTRPIPALLRGRTPQGPRMGAASTPRTAVRVCRACASALDANEDADLWVDRLRVNPFLTIRDWRVLAQTNAVLQQAVAMLLTVWRRLAYALPWTELTPVEARMLRANRHLLGGHARTTMLAMISGAAPCPRGPRVACGSLGCYRYCTRHLRIGDAVEILHRRPFDVGARALAMEGLLSHGRQALEPYVTVLLRIGTHDPALVHDVLVPLVRHGPALAHRILWRARAVPGIAACLRQSLDEATRDDIHRSEVWAAGFEALLRGTGTKALEADCALPGCHHLRVRRVLLDQMHTIEDSASRPTVVPVLLHDTDTGTDDVQHLLYKPGQRLHRDLAAMDATRMLRDAFAHETRAHVPAVLYHTAQLQHGGLILMVPGARSLSSIRKSGVSLLNFLIDNNPGVRSGVLRDTFVRSCAFGSVLTLLLGVGDRHLDNIMVQVCSRFGGVLFHIDFDYLLAEEPVHLQHRQGVPRLRITGSIEDALGGSRSHDFRKFRELCAAYMAVAQRHARELFYILEGHDVGAPGQVEAHLRSWMMDAEASQTVQLRIDQVVRQATRYRTIDSVMDHLHGASQAARTFVAAGGWWWSG